MAISIASAPVSWGIMESVEYPPDYPWTRVLDEIQKAGYSGTELGPHGFLPTDAAMLRGELERRGLTLCSAFVAMRLGDDSLHDRGLGQVARTGHLISQVGCRLLILSDEITPERCAAAGRPDEANRLSWTETAWKTARNAIRKVIAFCDELGLRVAFHHHVGTHVETPQEVDQLLSMFSPEELGLCLDTGHYVYGGGDVKDLLSRHAERVLCAHLKDIDAKRLAEARRQGIDFYAAVRHGVFAPLGQGAIDFPGVLAMLRDNGFSGWAVVEQDVLAGGRGATTPLVNATAGRRFLHGLGY